MIETLLIFLVIFIVGSIAIKLLGGIFRIGIIVLLVVVLFGGGWATVGKWSDDVGDKASEQIGNAKDSMDDEIADRAAKEAQAKKDRAKKKREREQRRQENHNQN